MAAKQLIVVVEGTAATGSFWPTIMSDYLEKIIRCFYGNESSGQKLSYSHIELALVVFNTHGPYSAFLVQRTGWTKDIDVFLSWLSSIPFIGGGFSEVAIAEGLAEALMEDDVSKNRCLLDCEIEVGKVKKEVESKTITDENITHAFRCAN